MRRHVFMTPDDLSPLPASITFQVRLDREHFPVRNSDAADADVENPSLELEIVFFPAVGGVRAAMSNALFAGAIERESHFGTERRLRAEGSRCAFCGVVCVPGVSQNCSDQKKNCSGDRQKNLHG